MFSGRWVGSVGSNGYLRSVCAGFLLWGHGVMLPLGDGQFKMVTGQQSNPQGDSKPGHFLLGNIHSKTTDPDFFPLDPHRPVNLSHLRTFLLWFCVNLVLETLFELQDPIYCTPFFFFFSTLLTLHSNALVVKRLAKKTNTVCVFPFQQSVLNWKAGIDSTFFFCLIAI